MQDGVRRVSFSEAFEDETRLAAKIPQSRFSSQGRYQIIDQGDNQVAGYSDAESGVYENVPVIVFGDHTRTVKYVDAPFLIGADGVKILKPKSNLFPRYAYYALRATRIPSLGYSRHFKVLKESTFRLPPLAEQNRIAAKLDAICAIVSKREEQLKKLDQLVKSRFVEMFGDVRINSKGFPQKKGCDLFVFASGKFLPSDKRTDKGVPVYGGNGIAWYTTESLISYPTITIGRVGAYCGNPHKIDEPVWITDNAIYIKSFKTADFDLSFLFNSFLVVDFSRFASKSGQPKVTQKPLEEWCYVIPPLALQREFAAFVAEVDKSKFAVRKSLESYQKLYRQQLQEAFG